MPSDHFCEVVPDTAHGRADVRVVALGEALEHEQKLVVSTISSW